MNFATKVIFCKKNFACGSHLYGKLHIFGSSRICVRMERARSTSLDPTGILARTLMIRAFNLSGIRFVPKWCFQRKSTAGLLSWYFTPLCLRSASQAFFSNHWSIHHFQQKTCMGPLLYRQCHSFSRSYTLWIVADHQRGKHWPHWQVLRNLSM